MKFLYFHWFGKVSTISMVNFSFSREKASSAIIMINFSSSCEMAIALHFFSKQIMAIFKRLSLKAISALRVHEGGGGDEVTK